MCDLWLGVWRGKRAFKKPDAVLVIDFNFAPNLHRICTEFDPYLTRI